MARLTISLDPAVIKALRKDHDITLVVSARGEPVGAKAGKRKRAAKSGGGGSEGYREGSLPARVLTWAQGRKRPFDTDAVVRKFKIKRAHASMVLSKLANAGDLDRPARGRYARI